jgi:UDP-N-acetyl-D-glucosamine dehydrogenase
LTNPHHLALQAKLANKSAVLGVIGLGYVGLPLAITAAVRGVPTVGFDIDESKMVRIADGDSYIEAVESETLKQAVRDGRFRATTDFTQLAECDVIVVCVPTPLDNHREPDLSYVTDTTEVIARHLTPGTLVVLESTTFPGTTREVMTPILETSGLVGGQDFFVAFSPEREDPGNASFRTATIPKIVAGDGPHARELVTKFYEMVVDKVVPVSTTATAEAIKITENVFRAVNIALVNELKLIFDAMDIDVWEVIDGAATKPFGFMPFYPGPGLGGHCIPIDPFYLSWKAREFDMSTRFIELAGEINVNMPRHIVERTRKMLDRKLGRGLTGARILVIGLAYKKNVSDVRESPSVRLMELLAGEGATADYHDPHVPSVPRMREHPTLFGKPSVEFADITADRFDAILIATDHDAIDYAALVETGILIVDTRNAIARRGLPMTTVTKA